VVNELVAENWKKILLNLSGVSSVDSAGVGELVASQTLREVRGADGS
jgi:anti-anti-sigma regulatory factor